MPEAIDWMTSAPSSADQVEPRPPNRLVPPMTAAAMALIRSVPDPASRAVVGLAEVSPEATKRPPIAASVPDTMNIASHTHTTRTPARRAASTPPPSAYTRRP
jgi:hypothetical protein